MTELRHGYTLADLHSMARLAVHTAGTMAADWHDRYETAWSAIAERLYAAEHWLPRHDFVRVGQLAIYATVDEYRHHHGYYKRKTIGAEAGAGSSPAFAAYWGPFAVPAPSPELRIVERLSLARILPTLTPAQREAILALAACDDYAAAARAVGATGVTFKSNVSRGRQRFLAWWHEGEQPSKPWGCDRRAGKTAGTRRAGGTRGAVTAVRRRQRERRTALEAPVPPWGSGRRGQRRTTAANSGPGTKGWDTPMEKIEQACGAGRVRAARTAVCNHHDPGLTLSTTPGRRA